MLRVSDFLEFSTKTNTIVMKMTANYNSYEIFECDNSVMLIQVVFGLNKHQKYI